MGSRITLHGNKSEDGAVSSSQWFCTIRTSSNFLSKKTSPISQLIPYVGDFALKKYVVKLLTKEDLF